MENGECTSVPVQCVILRSIENLGADPPPRPSCYSSPVTRHVPLFPQGQGTHARTHTRTWATTKVKSSQVKEPEAEKVSVRVVVEWSRAGSRDSKKTTAVRRTARPSTIEAYIHKLYDLFIYLF
jgi:hypothetical protein